MITSNPTRAPTFMPPPPPLGCSVSLPYPPDILQYLMVSAPEARPWPLRLPFFYGWIIVWVGFTASVFSFGLSLAAGLLAVPMGDELHWSRSAMFFAISLR